MNRPKYNEYFIGRLKITHTKKENHMKNYNFCFITGSQFLYGEETLKQVEKNSIEIVEHLNKVLPFPVVFGGVMKTADEITAQIGTANSDCHCAGIITFSHTFSPSKVWINGLAALLEHI